MANTTTTILSNNIAEGYAKAIDFTFGPHLQFANEAVRNGKQSGAMGKSPVDFIIYNRLNPTTSTLTEDSSGTAASLGSSKVQVTPLEKGNFVTTTEKVRVLSAVDIPTAKLVGMNAAESTDQYAMEVAESQTGTSYVTYGQDGQRTSKATIVAADTLDSSTVRATYNKLDRNNVPKVQTQEGEFYLWFAHPDVILDLRAETGNGAWSEFSLYGANDERIRGEIGAYEGFRFISTTAVKTDFVAGEEKQAATTVSGAHAAAATTLSVVDATGIAAGNVINVNDGTDDWALEVSAVSSNDLTINRAVRKNGFSHYATDGSGIPTALSGGEAVEESSAVYSNYAMGDQAFGYAWGVKPELRASDDPSDAYGRLARVAWYALHGIGELRAESLHKVYTSSSVNPNS